MTYEEVKNIVLEDMKRLVKKAEAKPHSTLTVYTREYRTGKLTGMLKVYNDLGFITNEEVSSIADEAFEII